MMSARMVSRLRRPLLRLAPQQQQQQQQQQPRQHMHMWGRIISREGRRTTTRQSAPNFSEGVSCPLSERGLVTRSMSLWDKHVMNLPGLGDSISEGVIVKWEKDIGDLVNVDDVVAVVETDKVSIEIRSENRGILAVQHAAVDDSVEVGNPLCTLDLDGAPAVPEVAVETQDPTPPPAAEDDAGYAAFASGAVIDEPPSRHVPLIKFVGKRSQVKAKKDKPDTGKWIHTPGALDIRQIVGGTSFGKPPITEEEMEAILTGGANIAPEGSMKGVWRAMRRG